MAQAIPMKRSCDPGRVASAVACMASKRGGFVTGWTLSSLVDSRWPKVVGSGGGRSLIGSSPVPLRALTYPLRGQSRFCGPV